jgi:hypothetical protein
MQRHELSKHLHVHGPAPRDTFETTLKVLFPNYHICLIDGMKDRQARTAVAVRKTSYNQEDLTFPYFSRSRSGVHTDLY